MNENPQQVMQQLLTNAKTLQLATLDASGEPGISYAPFVRDESGNFYIFVSGLSSHTQEIIHHPQVAVMVISDEQDARQIFARTRATYQCVAEEIDRIDTSYSLILNQMEERFGGVINVLRGLADFVLFRLKPQSGRFVMGFGQAFELVGRELQDLHHIGPDKN